MNIAICHDRVVPAKGGCEVYIADLIRRLVADRHEVHLYAFERDAAALPAALIFHVMMPVGGPRFLRAFRFAAACELAVRRENHEVVLGFGRAWAQNVVIPQGGLHAASADYNRRKHRRVLGRVLARIGKWLNPMTWSHLLMDRKQYTGPYQPLIIAPSRMVQGHFQSYYGIGAERVRVIPNAVDPKRFCDRDRPRLRAELRERLDIAPEESTALFVGHNYRLKGLGPLLRAIALLPALPFRLLVCGSPKIRGYRRLAKHLGIAQRVCFLGYRSDMRSCFFASDFLVHPSFYDPCSLVVLEALACGLPVITTRCNGAAELLHPPHDGLVLDDPHDYQTLVHYIEQMCDPRHRSACAQIARKTGAAWTFEDHYRALLSTLQEAAKLRQAA